MSKKGKKVVRIVIIILAVIGVLAVVDNGYRLSKELIRTVQRHDWSLNVIN